MDGLYKNDYGYYVGFSAVEAPDNMVIHWSGGPDWWHCDNSDFLNTPSYPQTRGMATKKLLDCRVWAQRMLGDGFSDNSLWCGNVNTLDIKTFRCEGAAAISGGMLDGSSNVSADQPEGFSDATGCGFNGAKGRIKCQVLQQFGYALHTIQDFYSHSNYSDLNDTFPLSFNNPPGIGADSLPELWNLQRTVATPALLPDNKLSVGCYPASSCTKRTTHDVLNKDRGKINTYNGNVSEIYADMSPRGTINVGGLSNSQRAINMAIKQTRAAWQDLQYLIIQKEGVERGAKIICAIASDNPKQCGLTKAQATQTMPQGTFDDKKPRPHDWVIRAYNEANGDVDTQLSNARKAGVDDVGITLDGIKKCGTRIIHHHHVTFDKNPKLDVHDIRVAGAGCSRIVKLLNKTYLAGTQAGAERGLEAPLQCISKDIESTTSGFDSRILCKNKDETIQVSFLPDCGNKIGECGY